jgi:hypothetical protein
MKPKIAKINPITGRYVFSNTIKYFPECNFEYYIENMDMFFEGDSEPPKRCSIRLSTNINNVNYIENYVYDHCNDENTLDEMLNFIEDRIVDLLLESIFKRINNQEQ